MKEAGKRIIEERLDDPFAAVGHTSHAAMPSLAGQALQEVRTRHSGWVFEYPQVTWALTTMEAPLAHE